MAYYDGDYLHGPYSICSTYGLEEEEELQQIRMLDVNGQCIMEYTPEDKGRFPQINISELPPALYIIEINGQHNQKLVKL